MSEDNKENKIEDTMEAVDESNLPNVNKRKKIIIIVLVLVILTVIIVSFILKRSKAEDMKSTDIKNEHKTSGGNEHDKSQKDKPDGENESSIPVMTLDEFIINLNTNGKGVSFLKLKIKLELEKAGNEPKIMDYMPIIRDSLQLYLRELRPSDLQGSIGLYRLREELLIRLNKILYPIVIKNVLFDQVLIQ